MGRMNLGRAFDSAARILVDQTQVLGVTGATHTVTGTISSTASSFRVTLAWTDAPGPTTGAPWVNNLNLEVTVNGILYRGNVFSGASSVTGGTGYSMLGTVNEAAGVGYQQISIPTTATGTLTFWLNVTSSETTTVTQYDKLLGGGPQHLRHAADDAGHLQQPEQGHGRAVLAEVVQPGGVPRPGDPAPSPGHHGRDAAHHLPGGRRVGEVSAGRVEDLT